jgi:hypothetical protein
LQDSKSFMPSQKSVLIGGTDFHCLIAFFHIALAEKMTAGTPIAQAAFVITQIFYFVRDISYFK